MSVNCLNVFSKSKNAFFYSGEMVKLLQNRTDFAEGISSLTNIQRQFFDSFVGQTFKVLIFHKVNKQDRMSIYAVEGHRTQRKNLYIRDIQISS